MSRLSLPFLDPRLVTLTTNGALSSNDTVSYAGPSQVDGIAHGSAREWSAGCQLGFRRSIIAKNVVKVLSSTLIHPLSPTAALIRRTGFQDNKAAVTAVGEVRLRSQTGLPWPYTVHLG